MNIHMHQAPLTKHCCRHLRYCVGQYLYLGHDESCQRRYWQMPFDCLPFGEPSELQRAISFQVVSPLDSLPPPVVYL